MKIHVLLDGGAMFAMPGMPACASAAAGRGRRIECDLLPLLGFENQARAHAEIAVADAGVRRIAIGRLLRGLDVGLRLVDVAEHQVGVCEPAERVEVLAPFGELHARVELGRRLVGDDVRLADVFPHAALHEDVRRHVERVRGRPARCPRTARAAVSASGA